MARTRAHVIFFPVAHISHFQPMVQLLYHLDTHRPGTIVTVVGTLNVTSDLLALRDRGDLKSIDLRLHDEPSWTPPRYEEDPVFPYRCGLISDSIRTQVQGLWEKLVARKSEPEAVTAIISDMFFDWCKDLADELGVPWYTYFSVSAFATKIMLESPTIYKAMTERQNAPDKAQSLREAVPGLADFAGLSYIRYGDISSELFEFPEYFTRHSGQTIQASGLLLNTTEELEEQFGALPALRRAIKSSKVFTIGPSLQLPGFGRLFSAPDPTVDCLSWLHTHRENSVFYVSFGSIVMLQKPQVLEVAAGLESSRVPFLWALKMESGQASDVLPPGFQERTAGWGRVETGWVPQGKILEHPATGGFLTHCGWNSILESICTGVPCIGWPISADQRGNSRFVHESKIGLTISSFKTKDTDIFENITRTEVKMAVRSLMLEEDGRRARSNVAKMQNSVKAAVAKEGSSYRSLHQFLDEIEQKS